MKIDASSLRDLYSGFNTSFNKGLKNTVSHWQKVAMKVPSTGAEENYSWLTDMPGIREWIGDRIIHRLSAARYVIQNKTFELTVEVQRTHIEDDKYGLYGPKFEKMGYDTARHPDELVFSLLGKGTRTLCFDGQYFFDTDHEGRDEAGQVISVSNFTDGAGPAWYLLDCSQPIKALVYQERLPFDFQSITSPNDEYVFLKDKYLYGIRGRSNAGFGLWQLAFCSKAPLNPANFAAARTAMMELRKENGKRLGIMPTHLVVPPSLDGVGRQVINAQLINGGESNIWANAAELICAHDL